MSGYLMVMEGCDGCGKSTIAAFITDILNKTGYDAVSFSEPTYDSRAGRTVRKYLDEHTHIEGNELIKLFMEDRAYDLRCNILPAMKKGKIVIMDRYWLSTVAYEANENFHWKKILHMNREKFLEPDITFILNPSVEVCWKRILLRGRPISQYETKDELWRTQAIYDEVIANDQLGNYIIINSEHHAHETSQEIIAAIKYYITKREELNREDKNVC